MFWAPETSVHVWDKNREISPLEVKAQEAGGGAEPSASILLLPLKRSQGDMQKPDFARWAT